MALGLRVRGRWGVAGGRRFADVAHASAVADRTVRARGEVRGARERRSDRGNGERAALAGVGTRAGDPGRYSDRNRAAVAGDAGARAAGAGYRKRNGPVGSP